MSLRDSYDVIVAGAGPVGLWVACELGMAGVSTLVLEKKTNPLDDLWVMGTLGVRAINHAAAEILNRRGLLSTVFPPNERSAKRTELRESMFVGHYAGHRTDPQKVDFARWPHILPADTSDAFGGAAKGGPLSVALTQRAKALGIEILYGRSVSYFEESSSHVKVYTTADAISNENGDGKAKDLSFTAKFLVGADGGRSSVRRGGNFTFVGSEATWTGYSIHCDLADPSVLKPGFNRTTQGMYFRSPGMGPFDEGLYYFIDVDGGHGRDQPCTIEHVQAMMRKVSCQPDLVINKAHLMGSFTDRTKQATEYRRGRIFLAGDSCHIHAPIGGQGLNLGLGDAMNLGWKLAAVIKGHAADPEALLESYNKERVPLGRQVLEHTRVQTMGVTPGPHGQAIYNMVISMSETGDGATFLAERVNWYGRKVDLPCEHWLAGKSSPDFEFTDGSRLARKLEAGAGKWIVIDFSDRASLDTLAKTYGIDYTSSSAVNTLNVKTAVVRPDGVVAWASDEEQDVETLNGVLGQWLKPIHG